MTLDRDAGVPERDPNPPTSKSFWTTFQCDRCNLLAHPIRTGPIPSGWSQHPQPDPPKPLGWVSHIATGETLCPECFNKDGQP